MQKCHKLSGNDGRRDRVMVDDSMKIGATCPGSVGLAGARSRTVQAQQVLEVRDAH